MFLELRFRFLELTGLMSNLDLLKEADNCRRQATGFVGRPESVFLTRAASAFEDLAKKGAGKPQLTKR